ncbi:hypothetical protein K2173_024332 [Erythroxylum novogranatense]|uniref:Uncharacterized protein n=1 Tax=Erythroxylum novogranatense TaxID=1862640 RepID=A0AAV8SU11_9ROSI|nr:hypothetical protein K2173_024332 [Erythroxylum novogranatense]
MPSAPAQQPLSSGQPSPQGPTSIPPSQAHSSAVPRAPFPPTPQAPPTAPPPNALISAHVAVSLPSHEALVSTNPTSPLPIPEGLGNEDMDVAPFDPQDLRDTSPLPPSLPAVPPSRPPDPGPLQPSDGVKPDAPDTTMEDSGTPPDVLPGHDPNGPAVPVLTDA